LPLSSCSGFWGAEACQPLIIATLFALSTQGDNNDSYALLGELAPCGSTEKQTCLKTVVLLTDNRKNVGCLPPHPAQHT
jgi:hypothetical protein